MFNETQLYLVLGQHIDMFGSILCCIFTQMQTTQQKQTDKKDMTDLG